MNMPKNIDEFEYRMLSDFSEGMSTGYGIEHTNIHEEEEEAIKEFAEYNGFKRKSIKISEPRPSTIDVAKELAEITGIDLNTLFKKD